MSSWIPIAAVVLALIAAGSIAWIAWELSSREFHESFGDTADDGERPPETPAEGDRE